MSKHFIKVTQTYSTKNRVQELVLNGLEILDHTLCPNLSEAKKMIKKNFNSAINSYSGRAKLPEIKEFEPNTKTTTFMIEDVVTLQVYQVSINFCN